MQRAKDIPSWAYTVSGNDPVLLAVRGAIDLATAPELAQAFDELLQKNHRIVELDLGAVEFIDSAGVQVLHKATAGLREVGGSLLVSSASDRVRRVFELSGIDKVLPLPARSDGDGS